MGHTEVILRKLLNRICDEENYQEKELTISQITSEGANYTSDIYKVKITAPNRVELNLFAKVGILTGTLRDQLDGDRIYGTERFFYTDLMKKYDVLQNKFGVPEDERLIFPKFYGLNANHLEETIILEDLAERGYVTWDRKKPIDWEYASQALCELAKFHALSFAYRHEFPQEYEANVEKLKTKLALPLDELKTTWLKVTQRTFAAVSEDKKRRLTEFITGICTEEKFNKLYGIGKWPLLTHGDYRPSNIMHKVEVSFMAFSI